MEQKRLPRTPMMMENASFVMQGDTIQAWPLLCDPTSRVIPWVKSFLSDKGLVEVKYSVSLNYIYCFYFQVKLICWKVWNTNKKSGSGQPF